MQRRMVSKENLLGDLKTGRFADPIRCTPFLPLMNEGMLPPVRNPTTSSVNELQLNSVIMISIRLNRVQTA